MAGIPNFWVRDGDAVPETDEAVVAKVKEMNLGPIADPLLGLYRVDRKQGVSVILAWKRLLMRHLGEAHVDRVLGAGHFAREMKATDPT